MNLTRETIWGEPSAEALALPFFNLLPEDKVGLLKVRLYIRKRCLRDLEFRESILQMCKHDCAFFCMILCWFHETRETEDQIGEFPAFLDPDQVDILAWWQKWVGTIDITVEKTRGVGLSYLSVVFSIWLWLFKPSGVEVGVLSKDKTSLEGRP